ncbi:MAG: RtcB family protein [Candidatus Ratteibacteria bacterium]|nr:RtcB family protein [Candidatus Ratteibacteria bacterium]
MSEKWVGHLEKIDDYRWRIPRDYKPGMRVPGIIYADEKLLSKILQDKSPDQVANVAALPGIVKASMAMPDMHWGYGFPIGGVAAFRLEDGIISPGGVGYDINCGIRMGKTNLFRDDLKDKLKSLIEGLFYQIPAGVGSKGTIKLSPREEDEVFLKGAAWAVSRGFGWQEDLAVTEDGGCIKGANPDKISQRARQRGANQLGTLGSGNHFLEIQYVEEIFDKELASAFGLQKGQITFMIHCGSRGLGHQVCDDYLHRMMGAVNKYDIKLPDRQLSCAPLMSPEGQDYLSAMACAANYAWANRQCIMHWTRGVFKKIFKRSGGGLGMELIYDVCHNIAKIEEHVLEGRKVKLCVHRKGATRSFGPNHPLIPEKYRKIGQPVIIPGDMGRASYLLVGTEGAMKETFGSTCHGAGRLMSRKEAIRRFPVAELNRELARRNIMVRAKSRGTLSEEAPDAYKNINDVVNIVQQAGISRKVAKMKPMGVVKG